MWTAAEVERTFLGLDAGHFKLAPGKWRPCSADWVANGSIGSTELLCDEDGTITKMKRGVVAVASDEELKKELEAK